MRILGIDPGLAIVGYGIIDLVGSEISLVEYGVINTTADTPFTDRLDIIYKELDDLIKEFNPDDMVLEELFFHKNQKTIINVAQARGIEILCGIHNNLPIYEYTPLEVKMAITGYGRAQKRQMQESLKIYLNLSDIPKPDDAADRIAVAICHAFGSAFKETHRMR